MVGDEPFHGLGADRLDAPADARHALADEEPDEKRNVASALAQRWQLDREDVETIVEILAELAVAYRLAQIAVGGGDDAHVGLDGLVAPDALELVLLQDAQDLDLCLLGHLPDLVEEDGAAVGQLESADAALHRARERASLVAEQLGLEQRGGQRRAVELDERAIMPLAVEMDRARDQLLTGTRLPGDQDRGVGARHPSHFFERLEERWAGPHDLLEIVDRLDLFLQVEVLRLPAGLLLLHEHAVGDVDEHRPRVLAVGLGLGPPLDEDRLAVALAAQFEDHAARVRAPADGGECLLDAPLRLGRLGRHLDAHVAHHFLGLEAEDAYRRAVRADEARL